MSGNGEYVDISDNNVSDPAAGWVAGENILLAKYNQTFNLTTEVYSNYNQFVAELQDLIGAADRTFTIPDVVSDVVITPLSQNNMPDRPGIGTLPGYYEPGTTNPITMPNAPALAALPAVDFSFTEPEKPARVNPALGYEDVPYTSEIWLSIFTRIRDYIENPGAALGAAVEEGVWQRARDRGRIEGEIAYQKGTKEITMRGLLFPQPAVRALEQEMGKEVLRQNVNLAYDISAKQAELAMQNTQFFFTAAMNGEKLLRDFFISFRNLSLEAKKAAANLILQSYSEGIKGFAEEWRGIGIKFDAGIKRIQAVVSSNQLLGDIFDIQSKVSGAKVEMITKQREGILQAGSIGADVYKAETQALAAWYGALTEHQQAQLKKAELLLQQAVEKVKADLQAYLGGLSLKEKVSESKAGLAAQVLASALNAINTSISHGTSGSKSVSETYGHSEALHESHSTEHDPEA